MQTDRWCRCLLVWSLLGALQGQVFIVDAAGGAGAHFTNLATAVSSVSSGSTLRVRPGRYPSLTIDGKGLSVVGEGLVEIGDLASTNPTPIVVRNTDAAQTVLLRNLSVFGGATLVHADVAVSRAAGPVLLEQLTTIVRASPTGVGLMVDASADVQVHGCSFVLASEVPYGQPALARVRVIDSAVQISSSRVLGRTWAAPTWLTSYNAAPGMAALQLLRSRAVVVDSALTAGQGNRGCAHGGPFRCSYQAAGPGGSAVTAERSSLTALRATLVGGDGRDGWTDISGPVAPSNGGDGVIMRSSSSARVRGGRLTPGSGGAGGGVAGALALVDATSSFSLQLAARPTAGEVLGVQELGRTLEFVARGAGSSPIVLLLSYRAALVPIEPLADGSLLAAPAMTLGPFGIAPNGELRAPLVLPSVWPLGETYAAQFVSLEPGMNTIWLSNAFPLHVNH